MQPVKLFIIPLLNVDINPSLTIRNLYNSQHYVIISQDKEVVHYQNNRLTMGLSIVKDLLVFSDFPNVCVSHCMTLPQSPLVCQWWVHGECQLNPPDATKEFAALTTSSTQLDFCQS